MFPTELSWHLTVPLPRQTRTSEKSDAITAAHTLDGPFVSKPHVILVWLVKQHNNDAGQIEWVNE